MPRTSRPNRNPPGTASFSRACCHTTNSVDPGLYSHRSTLVVRNDFTLKSGLPFASRSYAYGNPDFNVKSFRTTNVLRWEYKPGSTLFVVRSEERRVGKECRSRWVDDNCTINKVET